MWRYNKTIWFHKKSNIIQFTTCSHMARTRIPIVSLLVCFWSAMSVPQLLDERPLPGYKEQYLVCQQDIILGQRLYIHTSLCSNKSCLLVQEVWIMYSSTEATVSLFRDTECVLVPWGRKFLLINTCILNGGAVRKPLINYLNQSPADWGLAINCSMRGYGVRGCKVGPWLAE